MGGQAAAILPLPLFSEAPWEIDLFLFDLKKKPFPPLKLALRRAVADAVNARSTALEDEAEGGAGAV